jgi:hypothetical protein
MHKSPRRNNNPKRKSRNRSNPKHKGPQHNNPKRKIHKRSNPKHKGLQHKSPELSNPQHKGLQSNSHAQIYFGRNKRYWRKLASTRHRSPMKRGRAKTRAR